MRKRIDARNRKAEIGVELVRDPKGIRLEAETQETAVPIE
jgi:hypothetical protein